MKFNIVKEPLLELLTDFSEIISKKTTIPIISHIFIQADSNEIIIKGTDTEVSLKASIAAKIFTEGMTTVPGSKFLDIVRHLKPNSEVTCWLEEEQFHIKASGSHFRLATLPAEDFPVAEEIGEQSSIELNSDLLNNIMQKVRFSMANQDVRYYLNGMLLKTVEDGQAIHAVSTDGHRLSCAKALLDKPLENEAKLLIPKKGVQELIKMLNRVDRTIELKISERQLQLNLNNYQLTTRLIDGQFPKYESVLPPKQEQPIIIDRENFLQALQRAKVLLIDRHDGVRLRFEGHQVYLSARNIENETADEMLDIINAAEIILETSLNINYLMDAISHIDGENVQLHFQDGDSPCLITSQSDTEVHYVIMPMRL